MTNPTPGESTVKPRSEKCEAPFCWQSKLALERIEKGRLRNPAQAKLVYLALTWIASDARSSTFTEEIAGIATKASVGYRTVWNVLPDLERLHLVKITRSKMRVPHSYTLCTVCNTSCTQRRTFGTRKQHSGADNISPITHPKGGVIEEGKKEGSQPTDLAHSTNPPSPPIPPEGADGVKEDFDFLENV